MIEIGCVSYSFIPQGFRAKAAQKRGFLIPGVAHG